MTGNSMSKRSGAQGTADPFFFFFYLSYHATHTTTAERRVEKQCRRGGASSGQKTKRGIEGEDMFLFLFHSITAGTIPRRPAKTEKKRSASTKSFVVLMIGNSAF